MSATETLFDLWYSTVSSTMTQEAAREMFDRTLSNADFNVKRLIAMSKPGSMSILKFTSSLESQAA